MATDHFFEEYKKITDQIGAYEATVILGGLKNYKRMRVDYTYEEILHECLELNREW
jgi:hypothetical protein